MLASAVMLNALWCFSISQTLTGKHHKNLTTGKYFPPSYKWKYKYNCGYTVDPAVRKKGFSLMQQLCWGVQSLSWLEVSYPTALSVFVSPPDWHSMMLVCSWMHPEELLAYQGWLLDNRTGPFSSSVELTTLERQVCTWSIYCFCEICLSFL